MREKTNRPTAAAIKTDFFVMLVSHCGEYMANGLTNAVRHEFDHCEFSHGLNKENLNLNLNSQ